MMTIDNFRVSTITFGTFRLDGGAMFGSVPKNLWINRIAADEENCIPLATRCLLIEIDERKILVDVGLGSKWNEKSKEIYRIKNFTFEELAFDPESVTDLILTHLHFDHGGGVSRYKQGSSGELELCFPKARVHLQQKNLTLAQKPNVRERASYLRENVEPLTRATLNLLHGTTEILPGLWVHEINGHTEGQQWIEVRGKETSVMYPSDLIPTAQHLPLPFHMGYDMCVATLLKEKEYFLTYAMERDATVVFEHDTALPAARVGKDERGHYAVREKLSI